jgi:hypothetical protein
MTLEEAWDLIDMMESYFTEFASDKDGEPNREMQFAYGCAALLQLLEKLDAPK